MVRAVAGRRSREDEVAGAQLGHLGDVCDQRRDVEEHVGRALVLHRPPLTFSVIGAPSGRRRARPDEQRPGRQERRRALAREPVQAEAARVGADERVARRDVVADRVAGDRVQRLVARHAARRPADHRRELELPVVLLGVAGQHDVVVRADDRVRALHEHERPPGARALVELLAGAIAVGGGQAVGRVAARLRARHQLEDVLTVVGAGAEHLPRGRAAARAGGQRTVFGRPARAGRRAPAAPRGSVPRVDERTERDPVADMRAEIHDALVEQHEPGERPAVGRRERPQCEAG